MYTVDVDFDNMTQRKDRFENANPKDKKKIRDREKKTLLERIFES
jgi:hypothetical protein